jgi:hypothetical protein
MKVFQLLCVLFFISACTNSTVNDSSNELSENNKDSIETLCFQRLYGSVMKDTSLVRLIINGDIVTGYFMHLPYEKDSRRGNITATKQGDIIKGIWIYTQEGMQDTLSVEFKLNGNTLMQKNYSINLKTGREFLSDTSRFATEYKKIDCK